MLFTVISTYRVVSYKAFKTGVAQDSLLGSYTAWDDVFVSTYLFIYLLTYLLPHSMEQSRSWETNRFLASHEIPRILWNPNVHYRIHKYPSPVPLLSQINPIHALTSLFLKIYLNDLPSTSGSSKWSRSLRFPHQNPEYTSSLLHTGYMPRPPHSSRFNHPNSIGWGVRIIKLLIM